MVIIEGNNFTTEIKVGQKWEVFSKHFMAFHRLKKHKPELIPAFSKFEILYPEEWYFRLDDGRVFFAKPHDILEHCNCLDDKTINIKKILETPKKVIEVKGRYKYKLPKTKNENI